MKSHIFLNFLASAFVLAFAEGCSPDAKIEVSGPVLPPEDVVLTDVSGTSLTFSWSAVEGALGYTVRLDNVSTGEYYWEQITATSYTFEGLTTGAEYLFKVRVRTAAGESDYTEEFKAVPGESQPGGDDKPDDPEDEPDEPLEGYEKFLIPSHEEDGTARAFPGAEGGGMYVTGGRGGKVIHVTNLNDSGYGSLREAVEASGPRTVVFDVAGIIELESKLKIRNGDITIAGQTAPGDGICIKNYATVIEADNVIIRFIRFRLGDEGPDHDDGEDAIWGRRQSDIIVDHCSMSWSIDECASFYGNENFTLQWSIMTESLKRSVHGKGNHGYGGIWGGENASFHHNMLSCHDSRNPRFDHPEIYENPSSPDKRGNVDYRNNVVYNWGSNSTYGGEGGHFNMVNNYYKQGPASRDREYFIDANGIYTSSGKDYGYPYLYMAGNYYVQYPSMTAQDGVYWHDDGTNTPPDPSRLLSSCQTLSGPSGEPVYTSTHSAQGAFEAVCDYAGASLERDAVDDRAVSDARSGKATCTDGGNGSIGGLVDTPSAVGGWPQYDASDDELAAAEDADGDGMPDWFETEFGLDPSDPADGTAMNLDPHGRYTNLEMYLHYLVKDIVSVQSDGSAYVRL